MINSKHVLSVGLAVAALAVVLPFFAGRVLIYQPSLAPLLVQVELVPGTGLAWFASVFGTIALALGAASFGVA